jgi:hypothetical protein
MPYGQVSIIYPYVGVHTIGVVMSSRGWKGGGPFGTHTKERSYRVPMGEVDMKATLKEIHKWEPWPQLMPFHTGIIRPWLSFHIFLSLFIFYLITCMHFYICFLVLYFLTYNNGIWSIFSVAWWLGVRTNKLVHFSVLVTCLDRSPALLVLRTCLLNTLTPRARRAEPWAVDLSSM